MKTAVLGMRGVFAETTRAAETGEDRNRGAVLEDAELLVVERDKCAQSLQRTVQLISQAHELKRGGDGEEEDFRSVENLGVAADLTQRCDRPDAARQDEIGEERENV